MSNTSPPVLGAVLPTDIFSKSCSIYQVHWVPTVMRSHILFKANSLFQTMMVSRAVWVRLSMTTIWSFPHGLHEFDISIAHLPSMVLPVCLFIVPAPTCRREYCLQFEMTPLDVRFLSGVMPTLTGFQPLAIISPWSMWPFLVSKCDTHNRAANSLIWSFPLIVSRLGFSHITSNCDWLNPFPLTVASNLAPTNIITFEVPLVSHWGNVLWDCSTWPVTSLPETQRDPGNQLNGKCSTVYPNYRIDAGMH